MTATAERARPVAGWVTRAPKHERAEACADGDMRTGASWCWLIAVSIGLFAARACAIAPAADSKLAVAITLVTAAVACWTHYPLWLFAAAGGSAVRALS